MLEINPNDLLFWSPLEILIQGWSVGTGLMIILCYSLQGDVVCHSDGQKIFCAPLQILNPRCVPRETSKIHRYKISLPKFQMTFRKRMPFKSCLFVRCVRIVAYHRSLQLQQHISSGLQLLLSSSTP